MEEDYSKQSKEELIALVQQLEEEVGDLTEENEILKRGKRGGKDVDAGTALEIESLIQENDELKEKQVQTAMEIVQLKDQVSESAARYKRLEEEKRQSDSDLKAAQKRIDSLEKEVVDVNTKSRMKEMQSNEAEKQKIATVKETRRLFEENDQLREEVIFCS